MLSCRLEVSKLIFNPLVKKLENIWQQIWSNFEIKDLSALTVIFSILCFTVGSPGLYPGSELAANFPMLTRELPLKLLCLVLNFILKATRAESICTRKDPRPRTSSLAFTYFYKLPIARACRYRVHDNKGTCTNSSSVTTRTLNTAFLLKLSSELWAFSLVHTRLLLRPTQAQTRPFYSWQIPTSRLP